MGEHAFLEQVLVFLIAVVVAVPLFQRLKLGAILGYLAAGALIGPHLLGLVGNDASEFNAAELGVVILLFVIGLELSPQRLWLMRRAVFAVGTLQMLLSLLLLGALGLLLGYGLRDAALAGLCLALSSTAIGVQLLAERKELAQAHGRTALAVLLFQDLVAVPVLALLPLLGDVRSAEAASALTVLVGMGKVVVAIGAVYLLGRYLVRPLFRYVAATQSVEAFTATALLVVLGTAELTALAGLSMALGAFLAGLLLAESEYRHEIEANLEPFKGLLLGLFFIGVGVALDLPYIGAHALEIALGVLALLALKIGVLYGLGRRVARLDRNGALRLAALLAQGGEFAFVMLAVAFRSALIDSGVRDTLTAVVVLSMAATPLLLIALERWIARNQSTPTRPYDEIPGDQPARVIIAGFGRVGQIVARVLRAHRIPFTALEQSVEQVDSSRRFGNTIYYGDPARPELLRAARADQAEIFVLATDDPESNLRTARVIKRLYPHLKVYARARNRQHAFRLMDLQVAGVVRETLHSSLVLTEQVLVGLGMAPEVAKERIERFRQHDEKVLAAQHMVYDDETKLVQSAKEALLELEQIFEADVRE
jgi:glutathione-regulated potassium-efflux system protein KefB